jgi:hypothetical protein
MSVYFVLIFRAEETAENGISKRRHVRIGASHGEGTGGTIGEIR